MELAAWQRLIEPGVGQRLPELADVDPTDVTTIARLRKTWDAELLAVALELTAARRKAQRKFSNAAELVADVEGVEQATSSTVAEHKAARFRALGVEAILDLCCGIGGDAMSLARDADVTGIDHAPVRAWMCGLNAGSTTRVADVSEIDVDDRVVHVDPSRRTADGSRRWSYEDMVPPPSIVEPILARASDAALKLGPGIDPGALPSPDSTELEFISDRGTLVQAVLWTGRLASAPGLRSATCLPSAATFTSRPSPPPVAERGRFVMTVDPALERSGLLGAFCVDRDVAMLHPALGLVTNDQPLSGVWMTPFEVLEEMPWRTKRLRAWLRAHDGGVVEIKTRGSAVDTDQAQRELRGEGSTSYTIFGLRAGVSRFALVTRRVSL